MQGKRLIGGLAKRLRAVLGLGVVIVCTWAANAQAAGRQDAYGTISGINAYSLSELPASQWSLQLAAMNADGVQFVRSDADWGTIEPQPPDTSGHSWQFASYDAWVSALAAHHLTWQPILDYDTSWAQATKNNAAFAAFGQAVAARYGLNGSFWAEHPGLPYLPVRIFEVWNEENASPWFIDPVAYGPLYAATRAAIHAVDSRASVDVGGLSDDSGDYNQSLDYPSWYVIRLLNAHPELTGKIDGFALHPYGTSATDVTEWVADFRYALDYYHENSAPIDITELGWVTGDSGQEQWRAQQMKTLGAAFSHSNWGLREVAPYDWINPSALSDPGDFGFVDAGGTDTALRPAAAAWFHAFTPVGGAPPVAPPSGGGAAPPHAPHKKCVKQRSHKRGHRARKCRRSGSSHSHGRRSGRKRCGRRPCRARRARQ